MIMIMSNSSHPDKDSLLSFLQDRDDTTISLHLASCVTCRNEVASLSELSQRLLRYKRNHSENRESSNNVEKLNHLLNGDISPQQREQFNLELQNDKNLLREALHFASHSAAMKSSLGLIETSPKTANPTKSNSGSLFRLWSTTLLQRCKNALSWHPPLWSVVTVTACLIISVSVNLQVMNPTSSNFSVVAYQDNPVMTFMSLQDDTPGIGFFSNVRSSTQSFNNIKISQPDRDTLAFSWPNVTNAIDFTLSLYQITSDDRLLIDEQIVQVNSATFSTLPLQISNINRRFEWVLTGVTTDKKSFKALGGFIITNNQ